MYGGFMRNIYVVTHAQSVHHIEGLGGGWYDTGLTEKGHSQAEILAGFLYNEIGISGIPIYASDLLRTTETARHIADRFGSTVIPDSRLREMNGGQGDGKSRQWREDNLRPMPKGPERLDHLVFDGAESRRGIASRISEAVNDIVLNDAKDIVVVTHGFALTFVIMAWFKIPVEHLAWCQFQPLPATITLLQEDVMTHQRNVVYLCKTVD